MKLQGIISVGFDVIDQIIIRFFLHSPHIVEKMAAQ
jgi:hypothetical protein